MAGQPAWIWSFKTSTIQVTATTPGQAQPLYPGGGPVYAKSIKLLSSIENDGIILLGLSNVGPLASTTGGAGFMEQFAPGDEWNWMGQDDEVYDLFSDRNQTREQLKSVPEVIDISGLFVLLDNNPIFGLGLSCYLSISLGDRTLAYI